MPVGYPRGMTSRASNPIRRALVVSVATGLTLIASPALAGTPDTWDEEPTSVLSTVLLFIVIPVVLFGVILLLSMLPGWRAQHRDVGKAVGFLAPQAGVASSSSPANVSADTNLAQAVDAAAPTKPQEGTSGSW